MNAVVAADERRGTQMNAGDCCGCAPHRPTPPRRRRGVWCDHLRVNTTPKMLLRNLRSSAFICGYHVLSVFICVYLWLVATSCGYVLCLRSVAAFRGHVRSLGQLVRREPQPLSDVAPDVEAPAFHRRGEPGGEPARAHASLHRLADRPVLAVHQIPDLHRVARVEVRPRHLVGVEEELAAHGGALGRFGLKPEHGGMIRG